jgi:hypothetical protein
MFMDEPLTSKTLVDAFIGSKKVRCGPRPTTENIKFLEELIDFHQNRPIGVLTMWGAAKCYGQFQLKEADLLDYMALQRLNHLQRDVQRFHDKGINVKILWEDFTENQLTGYDSDEYHNSLIQMINDLGLDFIEIIKESSLIKNYGFLERCQRNTCAILNGEQAKVGWQGPINWDHHLRGAETEHHDSDLPFLKAKVSQYLGITLARYQYAMLPRDHIKLSFVPYPPTVPDSMRRGRVEWKVKCGKNCKYTIPPWCGFGVVNGNKWCVASTRDVRNRRYKVTTYQNIPCLKEST